MKLLYFVFLSLFSTLYAQKLLLFFIDGFRWDYITGQNHLKGFAHFFTNGVHIKRVKPVFPSDCHPNIYSMFTGLYPRYHGVLGNKVYHQLNQTLFDHENTVDRKKVHKWVNGEPLWVTAKNQEKSSFLYHVPICDNSFSPLSPSYCIPYNKNQMNMMRFSKSVNEAIGLLKHDRVNLAVIYNDEMDKLAHQYGPYSSHLSRILLPSLDSIIRTTLSSINHTDIHLAIVSDHGMASIAPERQIYLDRILRRSQIQRIINQGGFAAIWPKKKYLKKTLYRIGIASRGANFIFYTNKNVPRSWQVHNHELSPPILLVAKPGYFINSKELRYPENPNSYQSGWHGYDPDTVSMATPFLATGPMLHKGVSIQKAHIIDLYPLLSLLAGVQVKQFNNASFTTTSIFLRHEKIQYSQWIKKLSNFKKQSHESLYKQRYSPISVTAKLTYCAILLLLISSIAFVVIMRCL